jgi:hypothetical protein
MAIYIDSAGQLHHDQASHFALTCPHCEALAHLTPVSVPNYNQLIALKPAHIGIVYRCDSCAAPLFLKFSVKMYTGHRVELDSDFQMIERIREKLTLTHLPNETEGLFQEALDCFSQGLLSAFASMCRRTVQSAFADLGEHGKLRMFDQLNELRDLATLDTTTYQALRKVLFSNDTDPRPNMPTLNSTTAGVLLEVTKDLLYQNYVRRGRLQEAMQARGQVTPLRKVSHGN